MYRCPCHPARINNFNNINPASEKDLMWRALIRTETLLILTREQVWRQPAIKHDVHSYPLSLLFLLPPPLSPSPSPLTPSPLSLLSLSLTVQYKSWRQWLLLLFQHLKVQQRSVTHLIIIVKETPVVGVSSGRSHKRLTSPAVQEHSPTDLHKKHQTLLVTSQQLQIKKNFKFCYTCRSITGRANIHTNHTHQLRPLPALTVGVSSRTRL